MRGRGLSDLEFKGLHLSQVVVKFLTGSVLEISTEYLHCAELCDRHESAVMNRTDADFVLVELKIYKNDSECVF